MKKLIVLIAALFIVSAASAQIHFPFGNADEMTGSFTNDTVVALSIDNLCTYATLSADTNANFNITATGIRTGAVLYLEVTCDATQRAMIFGTNITGANDTLTASKTKMFMFVYDDDDEEFNLVSKQQID